MGEYKAKEPVAVKTGDKIELPPKRKSLPEYFTCYESRENIVVSVDFIRCSAFMRITADSFGNLNPNELKETICKAIDRDYELK